MTDLEFIKLALAEDVGEGDHSSLACIEPAAKGSALILAKENGILAGIDLAKKIFQTTDERLEVAFTCSDGDRITDGQQLAVITGNVRSLLMAERLVLNCLQRMSGIATETRRYVDKLSGLDTVVLDTRKTTPLFRKYQKQAVVLGGGQNHRMGLYDLIMLKDNHIDMGGGISIAIDKTREYLKNSGRTHLTIEIETRSLEEVRQVLSHGGVDRIMLDNFSVDQLRSAVELIQKQFETEASGGIQLNTIRAYAETGVDYISVGALTHSYNSLDISMKISN